MKKLKSIGAALMLLLSAVCMTVAVQPQMAQAQTSSGLVPGLIDVYIDGTGQLAATVTSGNRVPPYLGTIENHYYGTHDEAVDAAVDQYLANPGSSMTVTGNCTMGQMPVPCKMVF